MLYPLKFEPIYKERLWGGRTLETRLGRQLPEGVAIGESWEISGVEGDVSVVMNGRLKGNDLQELIEVYMGDLVGDAVYEKFGNEFPVLIKLIDAQEDLSIQVHPDDELAGERHNAFGKTEMWYVVDAEPGAALYVGFNGEVTREQYLRAVEEGTVSELLNRFEVKPGDAYFIPAGTIHAIGKGVLVAEVQQTSDITYRVDDWGRVDADGNPRQLHTELAVDAIDFDGPRDLNITANPEKNVPVRLVECDYFTTNILKVSDSIDRDFSHLDSFVIYICIEGELTVCLCEGTMTLRKGQSMLVPAAYDDLELDGDGTVLEVYINNEIKY